MKKAVYGGITVTLIMFLLILFLYPYLPSRIPIHWGTNGIDNYASRAFIFLYPGCLLFLNLLLVSLPKFDPKRRNYEKFSDTYSSLLWLFNISMSLFLGYAIYTIFYPNQVNMNRFGQIFLGILFLCVGNLMPRIKQNYFIGIKTPWALDDERVWLKTHRFAGRLWFLTGILCILIAFLPIPLSVFNISLCLLIAIIPILYSYLIYHKTHIEKEKTYD